MKFTHANRRLSGVVVPLSAIRSEASPGCGEFADLARIGDLATAWGYDLVQLLPVNDSGFQSSPYFALSAFALHPIYVRIGDLPDIAVAKSDKPGDRPMPAGIAAEFRAEAEALVRRFASLEKVPYESLLREKLALLRKVWDAASGSAGEANRQLLAELETWIDANPWIKSYAAFVSLKSQNDERPWWEWPSYQSPTDSDIAALWGDRALANDLHFWAWLQMRAASQFLSAAKYLAEKGIALMGDIPILMNKDSADVWARRRFFRLELAAGAPPDMYASLGQNWGFPIYNWDALEREGYGFWTERLSEADKYYACYRIDHVLGFFRIWALSDRESTGAQGHFVPEVPIRLEELSNLGFSPERIRWLSLPHIPLWRLVQAAGESAAKGAIFSALDRIGEENLFLFKQSIHGERDIEALPSISPAARDCLLAAWRDRALFEYEQGLFASTWSYGTSTCWSTLSDSERASLESLFRKSANESEALWAITGRRLLGALSKAVSMLACAEDLGSVPSCVPRVLADLGILGLKVMRWTRRWWDSGQPYIPISEYPELSVACPSVHDSSSLREWWESEADRGATWDFAATSLERDLGPCPERLGTEQVEILLELIARSGSRFAVYPIQELLAMSDELRPIDPKQERINVPGTVGADNWSYRMPWSVDTVLADKKLSSKVRGLAKARNASKMTGGKRQKRT